MITGIVVVLFAVVFLLDFIPFWKTTSNKNRAVYCMLMLISFGVLLLYTFDVPLPSPATPIRNAVDALFPALSK